MQPKQSEKPDPTMLDKVIDRIAGPVIVAIVIGTGAWMLNIDRTTQALLYRQDAQTQRQEEIAKNVERLTDTLPNLSERVSFIEKTRFTIEKGNDLQRKVEAVESDVEELKATRRR